MKKLISLLFIIAAGLFVFAQEEEVTEMERIPVDPNTGLITFQEVVKETGSQKELFNRAGEWLHHYFKQPVYVTQVRDAASGVIKGKHQFELTYEDKDGIIKRAGLIKYYFKIECKDGRYRYTIDNFVLAQQSKYPCERWLNTAHRDYNEQWPIYLEQLRAYTIDDFAASLKEYMVPAVIVEEEEW
jgi:preprotein translocase subunit Sec61beta